MRKRKYRLRKKKHLLKVLTNFAQLGGGNVDQGLLFKSLKYDERQDDEQFGRPLIHPLTASNSMEITVDG